MPLYFPSSTQGIYENKLLKTMVTAGNYSIPSDWNYIIVYNLNNPYGSL